MPKPLTHPQKVVNPHCAVYCVQSVLHKVAPRRAALHPAVAAITGTGLTIDAVPDVNAALRRAARACCNGSRT